ncbi:MAG: hypothetical protein Q8L53_11205 [Aestuariivirga sp.]|nr:hypothetical protein [Aestuariivirga sp.]
MTELDTTSVIGLSALLAVAAAAGGFFGDIAKTYLSSVVVGRWTEKQESKRIFEKYKNPLTLSASELANRFVEINKTYPTTFLSRKNLSSQMRRVAANSNSDEYYQKYKLVSTMYRFCAFLGWLEIYRRDTVFLASGDSGKDQKINVCISRFRSAISDGHLNSFENWKDWIDHLVFREELRAVGESMVRSASSSYQVMGYADFEKVLEDPKSDGHRWLSSTIHFFADAKTQKDFRRVRFCLMLVRLCDLLELLTERPLSDWLSEGKITAQKTLEELEYVEVQ